MMEGFGEEGLFEQGFEGGRGVLSTERCHADAVEEIQTKHSWEQWDQIHKAVLTCRVPQQTGHAFRDIASHKKNGRKA